MTAYIITIFVMSLILTLLASACHVLAEKERTVGFSCSHWFSLLLQLLSVLRDCSLTVLSFNTLLADLPQYQTELNMPSP